jgi:hypothetical protein
MYGWLQNSKEPLVKTVYVTLVEPKRDSLPRSTVEGLNRLCSQTKYSFVCSKIMARGIINDLPCRVVEIPEMSYRITVSMAISKPSPYRRLFNRL